MSLPGEDQLELIDFLEDIQENIIRIISISIVLSRVCTTEQNGSCYIVIPS
jgi:hypothetical protein